MNNSDPLDDWLSSQPAKVHLKSKRLMGVIRESYPIGVPALIAKSQTDRLGADGRYAFHLGTPDEVLRRICSWLLTHGDTNILLQVARDLWGRHGREDVALAALILANVRGDVDVWGQLSSFIGPSSTAEALLLSIEECFRAKHPAPDEGVLIEWCSKSSAHAHLALLTYHASWIRSERPELSSAILTAFQSIPYPDGDSLLARVRDQMFVS